MDNVTVFYKPLWGGTRIMGPSCTNPCRHHQDNVTRLVEAIVGAIRAISFTLCRSHQVNMTILYKLFQEQSGQCNRLVHTLVEPSEQCERLFTSPWRSHMFKVTVLYKPLQGPSGQCYRLVQACRIYRDKASVVSPRTARVTSLSQLLHQPVTGR